MANPEIGEMLHKLDAVRKIVASCFVLSFQSKAFNRKERSAQSLTVIFFPH